MKSKKFSNDMDEMDNEYIDETIHYTRKKSSKLTCSKWIVGVSFFAIVLAVAFPVLLNYLNQHSVASLNNQKDKIIGNSDEDNTLEITEIHIDIHDIFMNQIEGFINSDYARYNPITDEEVVWKEEEIIAYYGNDLTPEYIPDGLLPSAQNNTATVYIDSRGTPVEDTVHYDFYYAYNENDSSEFPADFVTQCSFSVTASKIGIVDDCIYLLPETEVKKSDISGTQVTFGNLSVAYDLTDSEGPGFDMYVAEFEHNNIEYQIIAEQMKAEEFIKIVASIIFETKEVAVDRGVFAESYKDL